MNINGICSTYDRTYTPYQSNKNIKYFAGFMKNEDGSLTQKTAEEDGKKGMPEEEETRTEIVVRPDGSKVLMITVTVGGQEAVTSVELAKPTGGDIPSKDISGDVDVNRTSNKLVEKVDYDERAYSADSNSVQ